MQKPCFRDGADLLYRFKNRRRHVSVQANQGDGFGTHRCYLLADGIVRGGGEDSDGPLGFVPDSLMDDPPATKRALLDGLGRLLESVPFENVLLAHGAPLIGDGRERVQELVDAAGRTALDS